jgi:hypothetical protein
VRLSKFRGLFVWEVESVMFDMMWKIEVEKECGGVLGIETIHQIGFARR